MVICILVKGAMYKEEFSVIRWQEEVYIDIIHPDSGNVNPFVSEWQIYKKIWKLFQACFSGFIIYSALSNCAL